jgi:hypothetical protein
MRRATAFEEMDDLDHALADAKRVGGGHWERLWLSAAAPGPPPRTPLGSPTP